MAQTILFSAQNLKRAWVRVPCAFPRQQTMACRSTKESFGRICWFPHVSHFGRSPFLCAFLVLVAFPTVEAQSLTRALIADGASLFQETPDGFLNGALLDLETTLWEQPKWALLTGSVLLVALVTLVVYLLYKQRQLERFRSEHMRLSGMLINAQEEERKRLASELHDDFSQRLALLSLALETAAESAPESMQEQMRELLNSASEIGADLHTLSHRLHSATLERLGLVPGVSAFCKEFTTQQSIPVAFSHIGVPRSIEPGVALCLFRVVQEGLRNVKKHSGASQAEVTLNGNNGRLHLSIADDGAGFDLDQLATNHGLGILSMEERARLIGARFSIRSEPQKGTRIDVWARVNGHPKTFETAIRLAAVAGAGR